MSSESLSHETATDPSRSSAREARMRALRHGVLSGLAGRGVAMAVAFLSVPLTIGYLGTERFGVWALVSSLLAWLRLADIGIGNGLNNALAHAHGVERPELVRQHVSTAVVMLSGISLSLGVVIALVWHWIDWTAAFGLTTSRAQSEVGPAMAAVAAIFLLSFPLSVATRVYTALQEGRVANAWSAASNVASLLALVVVTRTHGGLALLVIAVSGTALLVDAISNLWLFYGRRQSIRISPKLFRRSSVSSLLGVGVQFFLIQIMALVVFESDNFVIAHFLGADHVAPYNLTYKLFNYSAIVQALLFTYAWVAYSEAIARKDFDWVRRTFRRHLTFSLGVTAAVVVPLIFLARPFIRVWAGGDVVPSIGLVLLIAVWNMVNAYCSPIACLFAAANHMRAQLVYGALSTASNVVLSIYLVRHWGVNGVMAATLISYGVFVGVPMTFDCALLVRRRLR